MSARKFKAKVVGVGPGGAWCRVHLPFDVKKEWGSAARLKEGAKADAGDVVAFTMEPDAGERLARGEMFW